MFPKAFHRFLGLSVVAWVALTLNQEVQSSPSQPAGSNVANLATATNVAPTASVDAPANPPQAKETPEKSTDKGFSTEDFMPTDDADSKKHGQKPSDGKCFVRVFINIPHNNNAVNHFLAYPYPIELPKKRNDNLHVQRPLPTSKRELRNLILATGYSTRDAGIRPYPTNGWRWQYAYHAALNKSHLTEPNAITEMYRFMDALVPYARAECQRLNKVEDDRAERYLRAQEDCDQNRQEYETDATRKGYSPIEVRPDKFFRGHMNLAELRLGEGPWWIVGTRRVPGLKYYWQQPVTAVKGEVTTCELNEENALVIEGGW
jgi:hypothetical protein